MRIAIVLCIASACLGGLAAVGRHISSSLGVASVAQESAPWPAPAADPALEQLTPDERVNVTVYQRLNRSVVNINTKDVASNAFLLFDIISQGEGSGTVIDRAGHVLTNFHVIEEAQKIRVTLYDGSAYDARVVGGDPDTDVAVLKIDAPAEVLFPVTFGS